MRTVSIGFLVFLMLMVGFGLRGDHAISPAKDMAQTVAALISRKQIKHWVDVALHNPDPRAEMRVFPDVVKAVSAEEVELVIRFLEDQNVHPAEYKTALVPLYGLMSLEEREMVVKALQYPVIKTWAVQQLKQIHLYKLSQKEKKR